MFNKTLSRPMFRRGGRAGGGIMTGVETPRQGYDGSDGKQNVVQNDFEKVTTQRDLIDKLSPRYGNTGSDFFMGLGANILAAPGGEPIFQTLGKAAKEPLNLMMKQNMAQSSSDRELVANLVKNLDDETLSAIQKDARAAVASGMFNGDYNAAIKALLQKKIYGTQDTAADLENERIDFLEQNILKTDMTGSLSAVAKNIATHIHKIQSGQYDGTVDQNGDPVEFSKVKTFFKDGDISRQGKKEDGTMLYELTPNGLSKWNSYEGLAVYDYRTGKLFKKQGNNFVEVIVGEKIEE
tara:strand:+ start:143 stop:1027 length:885 start_codon:yes stop_codon:yes gene_type:complete